MRLILLNGPCGVGKTTVADLLHTALPGSVLINLDTLRRFVSGHHERIAESHDLSVALTASMLTTCAERGVDAIVDKMLYDDAALDAFTTVVHTHGGTTHEFLLWADKATVLARSDARGYRPNGRYTHEACAGYWETMHTFLKRRTHATVIDTTKKTPVEIADEVMQQVA